MAQALDNKQDYAIKDYAIKERRQLTMTQALDSRQDYPMP